MIGISIIKNTTEIIGIALIMIGLSLFFIFHNQGLVGQYVYSNLGCAVDEYKIPNPCAIANNQIISGFIGMIFSFFTALFGASLVVPSVLMKLIRRMKGRVVKQ
jgi:hypothetical protein